MPHPDDNAVLKAIAVAAELTQTAISADAILALDRALMRHPLETALAALERCQMELPPGRFCAAEVMARIDRLDGRPSPDEAWALCAAAADERATVVWTDEMRDAFAIARTLLDSHKGDRSGGRNIAARMAFKDAYERLVRAARERSLPARWEVSAGWDRDSRAKAIEDAARLGRLPQEQAAALLPAPSDAGEIVPMLVGAMNLIEGAQSASQARESQTPLQEAVAERIAAIRTLLLRQAGNTQARRDLNRQHQADELAAKKAATQAAVDARLLAEALARYRNVSANAEAQA